jgi:hypothetical protein
MLFISYNGNVPGAGQNSYWDNNLTDHIASTIEEIPEVRLEKPCDGLYPFWQCSW